MKKITLISYNIHKGFSATNANFMLPELGRMMNSFSADFVLLQETVGENHKHKRKYGDWPSVSQIEYLAGEEFGYFVYGKNAAYQYGHHGNGILSRHPVKRWKNVDVSTNWLERRGVLHCSVDWEGCELHLVNSHLSLFESARHKQALAIAKRVRAEIPAHAPFVIAGDFNDWRGTAGAALKDLLEVREAFEIVHGGYARTFPAAYPVLKLDRVYFSGLRCVRAEVKTGHPWTSISDHLPLLVEFTLE